MIKLVDTPTIKVTKSSDGSFGLHFKQGDNRALLIMETAEDVRNLIDKLQIALETDAAKEINHENSANVQRYFRGVSSREKRQSLLST